MEGSQVTRVEALLLDLDHTLFDPATIPVEVMEPVFAAVRKANRGPGSIPDEAIEEALAELSREPVTAVAQKHGWPDPLREACMGAYARVVLPERLPVYADVASIVELPLRKILVTTGVPAVQRQKVASTGLTAWVDEVHIDDVTVVPRRGKRALFAAILEQGLLGPDAVVVVGDRLESEIAAGAALGLRTAHIARRGCSPDCPATHCLPDLLGLPGVLWGGTPAVRRAGTEGDR
jgi:FMN phosphatase YigB (HAD superfamily)